MKFVKITENEHTKVMLDLEGLNLPEMAVAAEDVTLNIANDNKRNYRFVNEFLATLSDDRAEILATGLINMQRAASKYDVAEDCAKEFAEILTGLVQSPVLNLIESLRTFVHEYTRCKREFVSTIWYTTTEEMIAVASLLSALCLIPLNHVICRCHVNNKRRVGDIVYPVFENAIANSGSAGKRFTDYIRKIVDTALEETALEEKENKSIKDWVIGLIYINQFATNEDILKRGVAEHVIGKFSKYVLSSYLHDKLLDRVKLEQTEKEAQQVLSKHTMSNDTTA